MTIFNVNPDDFYRFTVDTEPSRQFSRKINASQPEETGNVTLFDRRGSVEKVIPSDYRGSPINVDDYLTQLKNLENQSTSKKFSIKRITPNQLTSTTDIDSRFPTSGDSSTPTSISLNPLDSTRLDESVQKKWIIKDILDPHYGYTADAWEYPNFHSLNFLGGGCLVYPNVGGRYNLKEEFSIDFHIKVNHNLEIPGTILHIPRVLCLFVSPGTERNEEDEILAYKLQLKIWDSLTNPSYDLISSVNFDYLITSNDNCLKRNVWHRVVVRRSTEANGDYRISFVVDGTEKGSGTSGVIWNTSSPDVSYPKIVGIGSFVESTNGAYNDLFSGNAKDIYGVEQLGSTSRTDLNSSQIKHPLKAEIHNLCIRKNFITDSQISQSSKSPLLDDNVVFFLPPFFHRTSGFRKVDPQLPDSGIVRHPFATLNVSKINGTTYEPFNIFCSFGAGGHLINIENFLSDFANRLTTNGQNNLDYVDFARPRVFQFFKSANFNYLKSADQAFDINTENKRRNLLILPNDNGSFKPFNVENISPRETKGFFKIIENKRVNQIYLKFRDENPDSTINLSETESSFSGGGKPIPGKIHLFPSSTIPEINTETQFKDWLKGFSLYYPTIFNDWTSNQIVIFEIPNLFYGKSIKPGTIQIKDATVKGLYPLTIKDDGLGSLYRADCIGEHAKWNSVGRVFYSEGLIVIKNPHLYPLGEGGFEISFKGDHSIHTLKVEVIAPQNTLNTSVNPSFKSFDSKLSPTPDPSDEGSEFVWISGLNFHDENFNIVAKTHLAQPVMKRHKDRILFRVQMDF